MTKTPQDHTPDDVFTPGSPIKRREFFRGRIEQIQRVLDTIPTHGMHPVIFGQRGVGKTSLANIIDQLLPTQLTIKTTCDGADTFYSIWDRALSQASVSFVRSAFGFSKARTREQISLADFIPLRSSRDGKTTATEIEGVLAKITSEAVIIFDEFDRVKDPQAVAYMADLIKLISDNHPLVTVVLVGVGESITDLISEHASIKRNLKQIEIPKMEQKEIKLILTKGFKELRLRVPAETTREMGRVASGYPHYAHLLGLSLSRNMIRNGRTRASKSDYGRACESAIADSIETLKDAFGKAIATSDSRSQYMEVLVACGHANHSSRGVFRATDVASAATELFSEKFTVQKVVSALGKFCSEDRGRVLAAVKVSNRNQYRFIDPMMRPFLLLKGVSMHHSMKATRKSSRRKR